VAWDLERVREQLSKNEITPQQLVIPLTARATYLSTVGVVQLLAGDSTGWRGLRQGWQFRAFRSYAEIRWFDVALATTGGVYKIRVTRAVPESWIEISYAAVALAEAALYGELDFVQWLTQRMEKHLAENDPMLEPDALQWPYAHVEPFLFLLFSRWRGTKLKVHPEIKLNLNVYQNVFDAWDDPAKLADAIQKICDYHCSHRADDHSFGTLPFGVYPVEVLALVWVRRQMGLETPQVRHPLLENPLCQVPESLPPVDPDADLKSYVKRCRELMDLGKVPIAGLSAA
jgi:hypothetical protein